MSGQTFPPSASFLSQPGIERCLKSIRQSFNNVFQR